MVERELEIVNRLGLHARAAAKLVHLAVRYSCDILVIRNGDEMDAKSILGLLQLGAAQGTTIYVRCDGHDEEAAMSAIVELVGDRFGEGE